MKNIWSIFIVVIVLSCSAEQSKSEKAIENESKLTEETLPLTNSILSEITRFIDSTRDEENSGKLKGVMNVELEHQNEELTMDLSFNYFVEKDSMDGFRLYKDRIIVFYQTNLLSDLVHFNLQSKDSIPSRFTLKKDHLPIPYESEFRKYRIINSDSLIFEDSGYR